MNRIRLAAWVTSVALVSVASPVFADITLPVGWYLDVNLGPSRVTNISYGYGTSKSNKGNGAGWSLDLGYKFMPYFATELSYTNYCDVQISAFGSNVGTDSHYALDLAGKGILPIIDSGFELFAKLGIAKTHSDLKSSSPIIVASTHTATGPYFGFGTDYAFSPTLSGILQWERAKGNNNTGYLDLYSIGIGYIFS